MDAGIISTRYARAIYEYAAEKNEETNLYDFFRVLAEEFTEFPALNGVMINPTLSLEKKKEVLLVGCGQNETNSNNVLRQVVNMIVDNGRAQYMENIALKYDELYRKAKGAVIARLTMVTSATDEMKEKLINVIASATGDKVEFHTKTNPDIIGGFILEIEDKRLDASVKDQLNQLRLDLTT